METVEEYEKRLLEQAIEILKRWRTNPADDNNVIFSATCAFLDAIYLGK